MSRLLETFDYHIVLAVNYYNSLLIDMQTILTPQIWS